MKNGFFMLILIFPIFLYTQIQWQENGIPIRQANNIRTGEIVVCLDGSQFYTWSDTRTESRGVYAQKIDINGNLLWGEEGIEVVNADYSQLSRTAMPTADNAVILLWKDWRNPDIPELRIQKIDSNGGFLWGNEGIILCADLHMSPYPNLVSDAANGVFVFWGITTYGQSGVYANHILADGTIATGWSANGNLIMENSIRYITSDNEGGVVFTQIIDDQLMIQRMDENRNFLWGNSGYLISGYDSYGFEGSLITNTNNSYYVVWTDRRNSDGIYCQHVDQNGNILWNDDVEIVSNPNFYYRYSTNTSGNDLIVSWIEENEPTQVIVQKINDAGIVQWNPSGIVVSGDQNSYGGYLVPDENNGCWVTWMHNLDSDFSVYLQHLNASGLILLEENGVAVCPNGSWQFYPTLNPTPSNGVYVNWYEERNGLSGIFTQVFNMDGIMQLQPEGKEIYTGISNDIRNLELISNANGINFFWLDNRSYSSQGSIIYMQSIDSDGNHVYAENGVPFDANSEIDYSGFVSCYNPVSDLISLVYEKEIEYMPKVFANAINSSGTPLWGNDGLALCLNDNAQTNAKMSFDSDFFYVGWTDNDYNWPYPTVDIRAQKIDEAGNLLWGSEGITITDHIDNDDLKDVVGRCYIWQNTDWTNYYLYAKLVDENGNTVPGWEENGTLISELEESVYDMTSKGFITSEGYLILWEDFRNGDTAIIGQLITEDGITLWQEGGIALVDFDGWQYNYSAIIDDELSNFYLVWEDYRNSNDREIYAQKFDVNGIELWQPGGVLLSEGRNPNLAKIGDHILVVWDIETEDYTNDIKAQLLNPSGEIQWQQDGIVICDAYHDQTEPKVQEIGADNFVISWQDNRAGEYGENEIYYTSIYTQKIYVGPTFTPDDILNAITGKLHQNYPNPFNPTTTIEFSIKNDSKVELSIYNIKGQKIKTLSHSTFIKGNHSIIWSGDDDYNKPVSSGVYMYKLNVNGKTELVKKCLLMK